MNRITFVAAMLTLLTAVCFAESEIDAVPAMSESYGGATVTKITGVGEGYIFTCDIEDWPPIIGKGIPVRIDGIAPPLIVAQGGKPNKFFELQAKKFMERAFACAKKVTLDNVKRGRTFSIIADVIVDCNSLADLMVEEGLARRYSPGEHEQAAAKFHPSSLPPQVVPSATDERTRAQTEAAYVGSKSSKVFHKSTCRYAKTISPANLVRFDSRAEAVQAGRRPCKTCSP